MCKGASPMNCSQALHQRTCKEPQEQFLGVAPGVLNFGCGCLRLLAMMPRQGIFERESDGFSTAGEYGTFERFFPFEG